MTDKYWIRPGMYVREKASGQQLFVENIERRRTKGVKDLRTGRDKVRTIGVWCSWFTPSGECMQRKFHTRQLEPIE